MAGNKVKGKAKATKNSRTASKDFNKPISENSAKHYKKSSGKLNLDYLFNSAEHNDFKVRTEPVTHLFSNLKYKSNPVDIGQLLRPY